jgi:hypothetical protein
MRRAGGRSCLGRDRGGATVPYFFGFSTVFLLIFLLVQVFAIFAGFPFYWFVFS